MVYTGLGTRTRPVRVVNWLQSGPEPVLKKVPVARCPASRRLVAACLLSQHKYPLFYSQSAQHTVYPSFTQAIASTS